MPSKTQLLQSLIKSFSDDPKAEDNSNQTLQKYSTEWIQTHHVTERMNGVIEKFEIQGQSNKYKALQTCFEYYQKTQDSNDENYAKILHLLMRLSNNAIQQNHGKIFRSLQTILKQIESSQIDQRKNEESMALNIFDSKEISEWEHEFEECNDDLSEWTDSDIAIAQNDNDDDDDDVMMEMKKETPKYNTLLLTETKEEKSNNTNHSLLIEAIDAMDEKDIETILYRPEVTTFEALVSALMGVDTIYFKWRTDHFVCLGSESLMTELCSLLHYANYYRQCKDIIDHISQNRKEIPLCIKAFFDIISEFLQIYRENLNWFVSSEYYKTESILELAHFMAQSFNILECIYKEIISEFSQRIAENTLKTHDLLSHLFQLLLDILCDEYNVKSSTIMSLFIGTVAPYFDIMDEWVFNGRLIDPFKEFFVLKTHHKNIWNQFVLCKDKIPNFLLELNGVCDSILMNGKALQILRNISKQSSANCKPFQSSFLYFKDILSKYYPLEFCIQCINPKMRETTVESPMKAKKEMLFGSPKQKQKFRNESETKQSKLNLDPIQMMTWVNSTNEMFESFDGTDNNNDRIESFAFEDANNEVNYRKYYYESSETNHLSFIHSEMAYIPLQHIVKGHLLPQISKYCISVNRLLLDSIDLLPHLIELKSLYFIEASDVLHTFLPTLIDILESQGWGKQIRICEALRAGIEESVYRERLPPLQGLSVEWAINTGQSRDKYEEKRDTQMHFGSVLSQIHKLHFHLRIDWPLNIAITPSIIASYNRIFKFLLQMKAAKFMIERVDSELRELRELRAQKYNSVTHSFCVLRHKLYLFINSFNHYCVLQMDTHKWNALIDEIMHKCIGLDEICEAHNAFIQQMLRNLFLPINQKQSDIISSHIIHLFLCSDDLQRCWAKDIKPYLAFERKLSKVKQTSWFEHERDKLWTLKQNALKNISLIDVKFEKLYKFCLVTIEKIKNKSLSDTAINVALHLDFNNFYSHLFQI